MLQEGASTLETESTDQVVSNSGQNEGESNSPSLRKEKFSSIFGKTAATNSHSLIVTERIQREAEIYLH